MMKLGKLIMSNFHSNQLLPDVWLYKLQATIGIDFLSKTMYLEDRTVRLQLWYDVYQFLFDKQVDFYDCLLTC